MAAKRGLYSLLLPGRTEQKAKGTGKGDTLNWHSINLRRWWLSIQFQTLSSGLVSRVTSCQLTLPQILLLHISLFYNIYFCSLLSSLKKCSAMCLKSSLAFFHLSFNSDCDLRVLLSTRSDMSMIWQWKLTFGGSAFANVCMPISDWIYCRDNV